MDYCSVCLCIIILLTFSRTLPFAIRFNNKKLEKELDMSLKTKELKVSMIHLILKEVRDLKNFRHNYDGVIELKTLEIIGTKLAEWYIGDDNEREKYNITSKNEEEVHDLATTISIEMEERIAEQFSLMDDE